MERRPLASSPRRRSDSVAKQALRQNARPLGSRLVQSGAAAVADLKSRVPGSYRASPDRTAGIRTRFPVCSVFCSVPRLCRAKFWNPVQLQHALEVRVSLVFLEQLGVRITCCSGSLCTSTSGATMLDLIACTMSFHSKQQDACPQTLWSPHIPHPCAQGLVWSAASAHAPSRSLGPSAGKRIRVHDFWEPCCFEWQQVTTWYASAARKRLLRRSCKHLCQQAPTSGVPDVSCCNEVAELSCLRGSVQSPRIAACACQLQGRVPDEKLLACN